MEIHIKTIGLPGAKQLRSIATARIGAALGRVGHAVQSVTIRLSGIHKPLGVADKLCRVVIQMKGRFVVFEELGPDAARVIERAAARVQSAISGQSGHHEAARIALPA